MKKFLPGAVIFFILVISLFFVTVVHAASQQAYSGYLSQFDRYRQTYTDFQLARDSYLKYRSLTSQTAAVTAAQTMMTQRNLLLRSYLFFLNEKLNEDQGLTPGAKGLYQENLQKEVDFLDGQNKEMATLTSLDEATSASKLLENHYLALQITIRQTIIGVTTGKLEGLARIFDENLQTAQTLARENTGSLAPDKIDRINRWLVQIRNTRSLYQQKIDDIGVYAVQQIAPVRNLPDLNQKFTEINKKFAEAQQLLARATSYLGEVVTALQYK